MGAAQQGVATRVRAAVRAPNRAHRAHRRKQSALRALRLSHRAIRIHMNEDIFILYPRKSDHVSSPL